MPDSRPNELGDNESRQEEIATHRALLNDVVLDRIFYFLTDEMDMRRFRRVCSRWLFSSELLFRKRFRVSFCFLERPKVNDDEGQQRVKPALWGLNEFFASSTRNVHINSFEIGGIIPWTESELTNFFASEAGKHIVELSLEKLFLRFGPSIDDTVKKCDIVRLLGENFLRNLKKLTINNTGILVSGIQGYDIPIQLLQNIEFLRLRGCTIIVTDDERKITPKRLELEYCTYKVNGLEPKRITVNNVISFEKIKTLKLSHQTNPHLEKQTVYLNMRSERKISLESVHLRCIELEDFVDANWTIGEFTFDSLSQNCQNLENLSRRNAEMKITEAQIRGNLNIVKCLPPSIQRMWIRCGGTQTERTLNATYVFLFPNLVYLKCSLTRLPMFSYCPSITDLEIESRSWIRSVPTIVQRIPKRVNRLKLVYSNSSYASPMVLNPMQGTHKLRLLIVMYITGIDKLSSILKLFPCQVLVLHIDEHEQWMKNLVEVVNNERRSKKTLIGKYNWRNNDFQKCQSVLNLDRKADYYCFQKGKGSGLSRKEFEEMLEL